MEEATGAAGRGMIGARVWGWGVFYYYNLFICIITIYIINLLCNFNCGKRGGDDDDE